MLEPFPRRSRENFLIFAFRGQHLKLFNCVGTLSSAEPRNFFDFPLRDQHLKVFFLLGQVLCFIKHYSRRSREVFLIFAFRGQHFKLLVVFEPVALLAVLSFGRGPWKEKDEGREEGRINKL